MTIQVMWLTKQRLPLSHYHNAHTKCNFEDNHSKFYRCNLTRDTHRRNNYVTKSMNQSLKLKVSHTHPSKSRQFDLKMSGLKTGHKILHLALSSIVYTILTCNQQLKYKRTQSSKIIDIPLKTTQKKFQFFFKFSFFNEIF